MRGMFSKKTIGIPLAIILMSAALALPGCKGQENKYQAPPPPKVTVQKPVTRTVTEYVEYTGNTSAIESVDIRARVEGFLQSVNFQPSSLVSKGELLFVIDPKPFEAKVNQAKAALATSQAELQLAQATLTRKENAYKSRAVSEVEVIQARAELAKAKAGIEAAQASLKSAQIDLSYTTIYSPIDGRISRNLVDVGNLVGSGQATLLANIVRSDPIYAYFNVSERDLLYFQRMKKEGGAHKAVRDSDSNLVYLGTSEDKGYPFTGRADYIDNQVDPNTGTIQVRAVFDNPQHMLHPGLFVRLRLPISTRENALLVPEAALGADQSGRYLYVVNAKDEVEYHKVELGALEDDGLRVIDKGITANDRVIVNGLMRVRPGVKVVAESPAPTQAKPQAKEAAAGGSTDAGKTGEKAKDQKTSN